MALVIVGGLLSSTLAFIEVVRSLSWLARRVSMFLPVALLLQQTADLALALHPHRLIHDLAVGEDEQRGD